VAVTQGELYAEIDLELSWSEDQLPQAERTKHVHSLHPYLGKFIPQLVDVFLRRYFAPGDCIYDPFAGSGTTLVEANVFGADAVGCDISAFNCLLTRVKTARYNEFVLGREIRDALTRVEPAEGDPPTAEGYIGQWFAPAAAAELLAFRDVLADYEHADVLRVVLARAARSARRTAHFDLEFPREPQAGPYWCHKHKRECRPVEHAEHFIRRYALDTLARIKAFGRVRSRDARASVVHGDARTAVIDGGPFDAVITSPPYPGLIDYHEQHRYAYELLDLDDRRELEVGAAAAGTGKHALAVYADGIVDVLRGVVDVLRPGSPIAIVVNDRRDLYPEILERATLRLDERLRRHVNRRTGRRAGEFFEDVLIARV
jgi:hypothetical protein